MGYPRAVGVLGDHLHSDVVLRRLLDALPEAVHLSTYISDPEAMDSDLRAAVPRAASPADLAARSEIVLALPDDLASIEARLAGPSGLRAGVHSPTILIIGSVVAPEALRELADQLTKQTAGLLQVVDAPVIGSSEAIRMGRYPMIMGSAPEVYQSVRLFLELFGPCIRTGGIGTAQIAKAGEQFVLTATTLALAETRIIAARAGIDFNALPGWGSSRTEDDRPGVRQSPFERGLGASLSSLRSALEVIDDEAVRGKIRTPMLTEVRTSLELLIKNGLGDADLHTVGGTLRARDLAGTTGHDQAAVPALRSGELHDHDDQNDDHQYTDDGADNSPVHELPSSPAPDAGSA